MNTPFLYHVIISRDKLSSDPFVSEEGKPTIIYDGDCDFELNSSASIKSDVLVGRYKLYIQDNTIPVDKGDKIQLGMLGRILYGEVVDIFPTNLGLTVYWDNVNN